MVQPSSDNSGIPIGLACELAGTTRQVRATWLDRHLVLGGTRGTCGRADVVDLACFGELVAKLGFDDARLAWPQVADEVRTKPDGPLEVVVDLELKSAFVARTDSAIARVARSGHVMKVITLRTRIVEVTAAFDRVATTLRQTERTSR